MNNWQTQIFLDTVRSMVLPRLSRALARRVQMVPVVWAPSYLLRQPNIYDTLGASFGETFYHSDDTPSLIAVYSDANYPPDIPKSQVMAFVLIHELGHATCSCGHEDERWADACKAMGIREEVYSRKTTSGRFEFSDPVLLADIFRAAGNITS